MSRGRPSTVKEMPPSTLRSKPVAVMTMSASSVSPDARRMPVSVKHSMASVTTDAFPSRMQAKRSPSGSTAIRCCQGR